MRKVALRLGELSDKKRWVLKQEKVDGLLLGRIKPEEIADNDFQYDVLQKGIDMKIGLDIASLSLKRLVDQIVLVSGDSDFVPAAKFARREGVDFILDHMWNPIKEGLYEHIDDLRCVYPKPQSLY